MFFVFFNPKPLLLRITAHINVFLCRFLSQCVALGWTVICSHSEDLIGVLMKADLPGGLWGSGWAITTWGKKDLHTARSQVSLQI